jgi:hypothetical protein
MKQISIYLALILLAFTACNKEVENSQSKAGSFSLTAINNANVKSAQVISDGPIKNEFQLGDLKASKEFFFLLSNSGDNPIVDITFKTDNPQFTIVPESISSLSGKSSTDKDNFIPLISLGILHGTRINGIGYTDILPMGENTATLTITGKTVENGQTIELESKYSFTVNAKKMDISLSVDGKPIDLLTPSGTTTSGRNYGGLGALRLYEVKSSTLTIQNIGNVEISLNQIEMMGNGTLKTLDAISILPDQSANINIIEMFNVLSLNSNGTISDDSRIQLGNDGKGYLSIMKKDE